MKSMLHAIIKKYFKLLLSVTLVVSLGFSLAWGLSSGYMSLEASLNRYVDDYDYPDGYITTEATSTDDALKLLRINGVKSCETRLCADTMMKTADGNYYSVRVFSYRDDEKQRFYRWSEASGDSGILAEYNFAANNGISAGDTLYFRVRDEFRKYKVQAIVSRPETLSAKISDDAWGLNYDFGYFYAPASLLREEYEKDYNKGKKELDKKSDTLTDEKTSALNLINKKQKELDKAKKLLKQKEKEYSESETKANSAIAELNQTKATLISSCAELKEKQTTVSASYKKASETVASLSSKYDKLNQAKSALDKLDKTDSELKETQATLNGEDVKQLIKMLNTLPDDQSMSELFNDAKTVSEYLKELENNGFSYDISDSIDKLAELVKQFEAQIDTDLEYLNSQQAKELIDKLASDDPPIEDDYKDLIEVLKRYNAINDTDLSKLPEYYQSTLKSLNSLHGRYQQTDIDQMLDLIKDIKTDRSAKELLNNITDAQTRLKALSDDKDIEQLTVAEVLKLYDDAKTKVKNGISEVAKSREKVISTLGTYGITEASLPSTLTELKNGIKTAESAKVELKEAIGMLKKSIADIESGIEEIKDSVSEISSQLSEGQSKLTEAKDQYAEGEKTLGSASKKIKEFADLEDELKKAYKKLNENEGYDKLCNQFMLYFDNGADAKSVMELAKKALDGTTVKSSYIYERSPVHKRIQDNLNPISSLMMILPTVFFAIVLTVVFLFMSMIINQSRRDIGILMALGISKASIRSLFAAIGTAVSLGGIILGSGIGLLLLGYIGGYFQRFFPLPEFEYLFNPLGFILGSAACIAVCLFATMLSTVRISRVTPKEAMSRQIQASVHIPAMINKLTRRLSPMLRFNITSLLRNKGRFVFSTICVAASVMFIFASISFIKSKNYIITQTFDERIHYDCQILLKEKPSNELLNDIEELDGISAVEEILIFDATLTSDGSDNAQKASVYAIDPTNKMIGVFAADGKPLPIEAGNMVVEKHTAEKISASAGDDITANEVKMSVSGVSDQCVSRAQYIALSDAAKLGEPDLGCVLCRFDGEPRQKLLETLSNNDSYLYTVFTDALYSYNQQLFATYDLAAWILIVFAVLTGFVIVFNTAMTNLQDNKRELCVLRTLGFQHGEVSRNRFSHSVLQFIAAYAVGMIPAILFAKFTLMSISTETEEFVFASGIVEALIAASIVFLYIVISHFAAMRSMKKWNPTEEIKDKE